MGGTIYVSVSYCDYLEGTPTVNKPCFINLELTLPAMFVEQSWRVTTCDAYDWCLVCANGYGSYDWVLSNSPTEDGLRRSYAQAQCFRCCCCSSMSCLFHRNGTLNLLADTASNFSKEPALPGALKLCVLVCEVDPTTDC